MNEFELMAKYGVQEVHQFFDPDIDLNMITAIHDRTLGSALGGIRYYAYESVEAAKEDVFRLARGMTYKNAIIHRLSHGSSPRLSHGGGKSVIIATGQPNHKTEKLLIAVARHIEDLNGMYIGGEDVGMSVEDIEVMSRHTRFIAGIQETHSRGRRGSGDPAPITALGVFEGIRASLRFVYNSDWMAPRKFAIQGLGKVGFSCLQYLAVRGVQTNITATDRDEQKIRTAQARFPLVRFIMPDKCDRIFDEECDVFVPCAMGGIINDDTAQRLQCRIVAGSANNQLRDPVHGKILKERGILYAPDYVINAGGAINVAMELQPGGYDHDRAVEITLRIGGLLTQIFTEAKTKDGQPEKIANSLAETTIDRAKSLYFVD